VASPQNAEIENMIKFGFLAPGSNTVHCVESAVKYHWSQWNTPSRSTAG